MLLYFLFFCFVVFFKLSLPFFLPYFLFSTSFDGWWLIVPQTSGSPSARPREEKLDPPDPKPSSVRCYRRCRQRSFLRSRWLLSDRRNCIDRKRTLHRVSCIQKLKVVVLHSWDKALIFQVKTPSWNNRPLLKRSSVLTFFPGKWLPYVSSVPQVKSIEVIEARNHLPLFLFFFNIMLFVFMVDNPKFHGYCPFRYFSDEKNEEIKKTLKLWKFDQPRAAINLDTPIGMYFGIEHMSPSDFSSPTIPPAAFEKF